MLADNNFSENFTAETSTGRLIFWRNQDVKRVNSYLTHCSKKKKMNHKHTQVFLKIGVPNV